MLPAPREENWVFLEQLGIFFSYWETELAVSFLMEKGKTDESQVFVQ